MLPQPGDRTVQFAAGLARSGDDGLLVSYGVLDCEMRLARYSLEAVLQELELS